MTTPGCGTLPKGRRANLLVVWLISVGAAVVVWDLFYRAGKAGDCAPHQIDGQCGLSTFLGFVYGAGAGIAIAGVATVAVAIMAVRRRRLRKVEPSESVRRALPDEKS